MKKESNIFEHGKTYRFNPNKTGSFRKNVRNRKYSVNYIYQLRIPKVFTYKGKGADRINFGFLSICRVWCEEVK